MNSRHRKILLMVFRDPVLGTIAWDDIEAFLLAWGCPIVEGSGFRVRFEKDGKLAFFHRPHPAKEAKRYQVKDVRLYLYALGLAP